MKNLILKPIFLIFTLSFFIVNIANSQTLLTCSNSNTGAMVSLVSITNQTIVLKIDWNEGSTFAQQNLVLGNATCTTCQNVGGANPDFRDWTLMQTDPNLPVTVAWGTSGTINYCGGSEPAAIPGTGIITPIPTLGEWGLITLFLIMVLFGLVFIKQRTLNQSYSR